MPAVPKGTAGHSSGYTGKRLGGAKGKFPQDVPMPAIVLQQADAVNHKGCFKGSLLKFRPGSVKGCLWQVACGNGHVRMHSAGVVPTQSGVALLKGREQVLMQPDDRFMVGNTDEDHPGGKTSEPLQRHLENCLPGGKCSEVPDQGGFLVRVAPKGHPQGDVGRRFQRMSSSKPVADLLLECADLPPERSRRQQGNEIQVGSGKHGAMLVNWSLLGLSV